MSRIFPKIGAYLVWVGPRNSILEPFLHFKHESAVWICQVKMLEELTFIPSTWGINKCIRSPFRGNNEERYIQTAY